MRGKITTLELLAVIVDFFLTVKRCESGTLETEMQGWQTLQAYIDVP